jgi:hypothetical protein
MSCLSALDVQQIDIGGMPGALRRTASSALPENMTKGTVKVFAIRVLGPLWVRMAGCGAVGQATAGVSPMT